MTPAAIALEKSLMRNAAFVESVSKNAVHSFSKARVLEIVLIAGIGVEGDAHAGTTVKHRSRVARDPSQPNLRQVHLIHAELFDELAGIGFAIRPGEVGENVTTRGVDLPALAAGTTLRLGDTAVIGLTGLRNPCAQLNNFATGLMSAVVGRNENAELVRKAGVMGVVLIGGVVRPGDPIEVTSPSGLHQPLDCV